MNVALLHFLRSRWMPFAALLTALIGLLFPAATHAASTNPPAATGGRYLFVIETSEGMKRRMENVQATLTDLLNSGLKGQLVAGDTVGLWTFDNELHTGKFPLQMWAPQNAERIAGAVAEFLKSQSLDKSANLPKAVEGWSEIVKRSERLTIVLVTDGNSRISGTPFDTQINETFRANTAEQKKNRMPFITVLRARKGEFIGARISTPPWPIDFPPFPAEQVVTQTTPELEKIPSVIRPEKPPVAPTVATNIAVAPIPVPANTNGVAPTIIAPAENRPPVETTAAPPKPIEPTPTPPANDSAPVNPQPIATTETPTIPPPKNTQASASGAPVQQTVKPAVEQPQAAPVEKSAQTSATQPAPASAPDKAAPAASTKASDTQTAAATPLGTSHFNRTNLLIGGIALVVGAAILLTLQMRKPRRQEKISLITHAVDRE